jgi:glycosyltransferase involved in cell wall biosynthesis
MIAALFPELLNLGGVQLAGRQIAATLSAIAAERRWQFHALSLNDPSGEHESSVGNLRFHFRGFARNKIQFLLATLHTARARPRIIFAGHPNLAPATIAMKFLAGNPQVIVSTHGIEVWRPLPLIRRSALRRADIVLAPSTDTARKLIEIQLISNEKIRKLPWPLDPDFLALAAASEKLPLPDKFPRGNVVLAVGRWAASERYKGADLLIEAVAQLAGEFAGLHLVLAGSGDDLSRLETLAQETGCSDRIHFFTSLSRRELAACYAHADVFALPSSGEGFGLVFLEAMAMKKPVIGTQLGGIPDIVEDGRQGILLERRDTPHIVAALRKLLTAETLREEMGLHARLRVEREFRFDRFRGELGKILAETVVQTIDIRSTLS